VRSSGYGWPGAQGLDRGAELRASARELACRDASSAFQASRQTGHPEVIAGHLEALARSRLVARAARDRLDTTVGSTKRVVPAEDCCGHQRREKQASSQPGKRLNSLYPRPDREYVRKKRRFGAPLPTHGPMESSLDKHSRLG
jgi:hypothetical protein